MSIWTPQPGPQTYAATCPVDTVMFGGTRGGGKSDCAIGRQVRGAELWGPYWNGLMVRRKYKDFAEIRRRFDELIRLGMPAERIGGDNQTNYIKFANGAVITLAAIKELKQVDDFLGHQYTEITIDEAPSIPFIAKLIEKFKGCLRSPHGVPCHMFLTGNPGGPGANTIKMLYIKKAPPNVPFVDGDGQSAIFIPSSLADNRILCDNDPDYVNRLRSIKDPALRAAWLLGDWDSFIGQAFDFSAEYHVVKPVPVPMNAPVYMTFDWGFGKPFSIGWWWVDNDGRLYRFAEWYGWDGETPDTGCRLEDSKIAAGILQREQRMRDAGTISIGTANILHYASHDCWNKKPDYRGGGQGPSTAEVFGNAEIYLIKADPSREQKIRQFRQRLQVNYLNLDVIARRLGLNSVDHDVLGHVWEDKNFNIIEERKLVDMAKAARLRLEWERPMMQVYSTCEHFIRTIPSLCVDDSNVEDVDTEQEDHVYDEAAQICMARPMSMPLPTKLMAVNQVERYIDRLESDHIEEAETTLYGLENEEWQEDDLFYESTVE